MDSIVQANSISNSTPATGNQQILGKDDFLKLMLTQMQYQDPLNPMDNQAMISQMSQFSQVEQMANLNSNFTKANSVSQFTDATNLLGKQVYVMDPTSDPENPGVVQSTVKSVRFSDQGPILSLENGIVTDINGILQVSTASDATN
jgi:flagellar basal-body rod modification protein FlgD